eukprot:gene11724-biopygen21419
MPVANKGVFYEFQSRARRPWGNKGGREKGFTTVRRSPDSTLSLAALMEGKGKQGSCGAAHVARLPRGMDWAGSTVQTAGGGG